MNCIHSIRSQAKLYEYKIKDFKEKPTIVRHDLEISMSLLFYFYLVLSTESPENSNIQATINTLSIQIPCLNTVHLQKQSERFGEMDISGSGNGK